MTQQKVFIYLVRRHASQPELLVLRSHDEPGYEDPKGATEPGESSQQAGLRELHEEAGITDARIAGILGSSCWRNELQHALLLMAEGDPPDTFEHVVTGTDADHGMCYTFQWLPVDKDLTSLLVQGCDRFVGKLIEALPNTQLS